VNDLAANLLTTVRLIVPELILLVVAALGALWGAFARVATLEDRAATRQKSVLFGAAALLAALAALLVWPAVGELDPARAAFIGDRLAAILRPAGLLAGLVLLIFQREQLHPRFAAEQVACLLVIVAGVNLAGAANDLIALFVALELVSIPTYVLLFLSRNDAGGLESTAKYFLLSVFSSAFVLYGLSIFMGSAGATNFAWLRHSLVEPSGMVTAGLLQVAVAMTIVGIGFRVTAVPFHFYAPDVFHGTSTATAGLLAVLPKVVGFAALLRLLWSIVLAPGVDEAFSSLADRTSLGLAAVALLTMTVGNALALVQTDLRRLLAYSSVAHAGYMLVGLAVVPGGSERFSGDRAVLFYLLLYAVMTLGIFGGILLLRRNGKPIETIGDLDGAGRTAPLAALAMAVLLFSLSGLPPTGGFWGKFNLFLAAWSTGSQPLRWLAVALAVNAAIAGWYYLRLVRRMYLHAVPETGATSADSGPLMAAVVGGCALAMLALFFLPNGLWRMVALAAAGPAAV